MLRIPVRQIQPGMKLARPIPMPGQPHRFLLQRGLEVPADLVPRLEQLGVAEVWIHCRELDFLGDLFDETLTDIQREVHHKVRRNFEALIQGSTTTLDLTGFQQSVSELVAYLKANPGSNILMQKLEAFDNYLMSHSTNTCYLAMLVAMRLEQYLIDERSYKNPRDAKQLHLLGLGTLLHDVGKLQIPREILDKPGALTSEEFSRMRDHPRLGYEMVKNDLPASAAHVVLNHHQRWDGRGYPPMVDYRKRRERSTPSGKQIPVFSRIAIIADMYDAATSHRCYSGPKLPVEILHEMRVHCRGFFDPEVERAFYATVPPFPIGQVVTLSDGSEAAVVDFNPRHPVRPRVLCLRSPRGERLEGTSVEEIDLAQYDRLEIASVGGRDVRPFLASHQADAEQPALVG